MIVMYTIKQPRRIIFGYSSAKDFSFPDDSLIITSKGAKIRGWINYLNINTSCIFDKVEQNPSMETVEEILSEYANENFSIVVGVGGGSSLDVAKYVAKELNKTKFLIPTTFGSGSEVTRISVLKINGKKQSFHDDKLFADVAIVDPFFLKNSPENVIKNSLIDACAQCTEAYDSKNANPYTKFMCENAFDLLEYGLLNDDKGKIALGSLVSGLGFGNSSTTLGHALSYVYSNEGISHGHALAFTSTVAHRFNKSKFYQRFLKLVQKLRFQKISLNQSLDEASDLILEDRKHLDNNPKQVNKDDLVNLLEIINSGRSFSEF